jgi:hypothetical protein
MRKRSMEELTADRTRQYISTEDMKERKKKKEEGKKERT